MVAITSIPAKKISGIGAQIIQCDNKKHTHFFERLKNGKAIFYSFGFNGGNFMSRDGQWLFIHAGDYPFGGF